jgi:hypothetical protein
VFEEALSNIGVQVAEEGRKQQWYAETAMSIHRVRNFLLRHSTDDDHVTIIRLPLRARMLKHGESKRIGDGTQFEVISF